MSFSIYTNQNGDIQLPNLTVSSNLEFPVGNVRIGNLAGNVNQSATAIAIGNDAGRQNQGISSIALGVEAGETAQGQDCVAIGFQAGRDNQSNNAVAVGREAGELGQGLSAVAVGNGAGSSTQDDFAVAVGGNAGLFSQNIGAVAVGYQAGENSQGQNSVAIGRLAGQTSQPDRSIILNATGVVLDVSLADASYMAPIRSSSFNTFLGYNNTTKEITQSDLSSWVGFTPTWTGITFTGGGEVVAQYRRFGNYVHLRYFRTANSYSVSGVVRLVLPVAVVSNSLLNPEGSIIIKDFSTLTRFSGYIQTTSGTDTIIFWNVSSGTFVEPRIWNSTNPNAPIASGSVSTVEISVEMFYPINH